MKLRERFLTPDKTIRLVFWMFSLAFLSMALLAGDRTDMVSGMARICTSPGQFTKSYFESGTYGGISGAFFNTALVCIACTLLFYLPGGKANAGSVLAFLLTAGFSFWGITALNIWFCFAGVGLYALIRREPFGRYANFAMFATGLAPLITDMLFRFPYDEWHGFTIFGVITALAVACIIGLVLPGGCAHSPSMHKGYDIYSAAVPIGLTAFFLRCLLYKVMGGHLPSVSSVGLDESFRGMCNGFCVVLFLIFIAVGFWLNGNSFKGYWSLLKDSGYGVDYSVKYSPGLAVLNLGVYGLFIVLYYDLIGATWNAVTFGCVFCMLACCFSGSHPRNVWPIMVGYVIASFVAEAAFLGLDTLNNNTEFSMAINAQVIVIGICFANGLSPISGRYGWPFGIAAGILQYIFVTCVPLFHGGYCLYNGGFTDAIVCFFFIPVLEHFFKTREEREELREQAQTAES